MNVLIRYSVACSLWCLCTFASNAQLIFSDAFNYEVGAPLGGQWSPLCSGSDATVISPGLTYNGYPGSGTGQALRLLNGKEYTNNVNFPNLASRVYLGFLIKVQSIGPGGGTTCGTGMGFIINFKIYNASISLNGNTGMIIQTDGTKFKFGIQGPAAGTRVTPDSYELNKTHLVVLAIDNSNYDLYVNPLLNGVQPAPNVTYPTGFSPVAVSNIQLGQNNYGDILLAGMRMSASYFDVVPNALSIEPAQAPSNISFTNISATGLQAEYSGNGAANTLAIRTAGSDGQFLPTDGITYSLGQTVNGGGVVVMVEASGTFSETDLLPETNYFYRIFSFAHNGDNTANYLTSSFLQANLYTLSAQPASSVASLSATGTSSTQLLVSFPAASTINNTDGYVILIRQDGTLPDATKLVNGIAPAAQSLPAGTSLADISSSSATQYIQTDATPGTTYNYAIVPYNWNGQQPSTLNYRTTGVTTTAGLTAPAAPTSLSSPLVSQNGFSVTWNPSQSATDYLYDISTDGFATVLNGYSGVPVSGTFVVVPGLAPGVRYQFRVRGRNAAGASPNSQVLSRLTLPGSPSALGVSQVLPTSFVATWTGTPGVVDHYEFDASADNFQTFLPNYHGKTISASENFTAVSNLMPETYYQFRVRAVNASGASGNVTFGVYTVPAASLQIANVIYLPTFNGGTQTISALVLNPAPPTVTLSLYHKKVSENTFKVEPATITNNQFVLTINSSYLDELGMEFYLRAQDGAGRTISTPLSRIYPQFDKLASPTFLNGRFNGTANTYQIISIPYDLKDNQIQTIFEEALGAYDTRKWRIGHYRNGEVYEFQNGISKIERGRGYWFNAKIPDVLSIKTGAGEAPGNDSKNPYQLSLLKGWNQIGNPYPFGISWNDVLNANPSATGVGVLVVFRNGAYAEGNFMQPFTGGFVFSENTVTLSVPVELRVNQGTRTGELEQEPDLASPEWKVDLQLQQGMVSSSLGGIGMHPSAIHGKDKFDVLAPPRCVEYIEVIHDHPEYFYSSFTRDIVPSAPKHTWKFNVEGAKGEWVSLHWGDLSGGAGQPQLFLLDVEGCRLINMREQSSMEFSLTGESRPFQIYYSAFADTAPEFDATLLGDAYPNPLTSSSAIPFVLPAGPEPAHAELSVYDMTGKKVAALHRGQLSPGYHEIVWDGTDNAGSAVPSGTFIYRLSVNGKPASTSRRLLVLK